jgi:hypothetical protein
MGDDEKHVGKKTLSDDEIATAPVGRRSAMGMIGGGAIGIVATGCYRGVRSSCTDADPVDAAGRGRCGAASGCTDSDPRDRAGQGVRCGRGVIVVPAATGCTDRDAGDAAGNGRCGRRVCTDSDPHDSAGAGRRC